MSSASSKKVSVLPTGLTLSLEDVATLKPKVLREHLKRSLNVLSDDWHLHVIVEVLAEAHSCDLRAVTHGVRVTKRTDETTEYPFHKGSATDKMTKRIAKFFYHNEAVLRRYIGALDLVIGAAGKKPLVLATALGCEASEDEFSKRTEMYFRMMNKKEQVFVTEDNAEYLALAEAFGRGAPMIDSLAVRLLKRVATRYGLTVYTSDMSTVIDGTGDDVDFISFAVLE